MDQNPQGFASEDEEATYCLSLLRDGDRHQKIVARERLSQIFERRGMLDEAAQCLESNIREGVRDPRVYQRLAGVYRRQGRHELADEVLVEARRLAERLIRPPAPGVRARPGPGRPGPGAPPPPPPLEAPTAQLPATAPPARPPVAKPGGELELDRVGTVTGPRGLDEAGGADAVASGRPWWLSPAMVVLLILLCGPYGLALMWVRGGYTRQTKMRATVIWAGLVVLMLGATAVALQSQVASMVAASAGMGGAPPFGIAPTPIVFPSAPGPAAKPTLPAGLAPAPPTAAAAPGVLATRPAGTDIGAAPTAVPKPAASPAVVEDDPDDSPAAEKVKVKDTGGSGVNLRERPGQTAPIVKTIAEGAVLEIIGPDKPMDGKGWRNVKDETGAQGFIAAELLEPA